MKLAAFLTALGVALSGCHRAPPPPVAVVHPISGPLKLTFGFALPWGPEVGVERARVASAYLAKALGAEITPKLFTYDELARALAQGTVDLAFIPPLGYVEAASHGHIRLLRRAKHEGVPEYYSVLFTRKESPARTIDDLKGKTIALVREGSASGNLFPRAWMLRDHLVPETFFGAERVLASHNDVCLAVERGEVQAGASFTDAIRLEPDEDVVDGCVPALGDRAKDLRIVFHSDPIPNDVIAVSGKLRVGLVERIGAAFDLISTTEDGRRALKDGFASEGFVAVTDADFDVVRRALALVRASPDGGR